MSYMCDACHEPIVDEDPHTASNGEDVHEACCDVCERGMWPAPDPTTRVNACEWHMACPQGPTRRYSSWGEWRYLCPEHGELVGDDGSMDDTYDTDAGRVEALKSVDL